MTPNIPIVYSCLVGSLLLIAGCSAEMSEAIVQAARNQSQGAIASPRAPKLLDADSESDLVAPPKLASVVKLPSPDRTNPFELSGEYQESSTVDVSERKREIRILGFIELEAPSVMLSLDGRTQVFKSGDTFDKVTVHEIEPPRARITYDGVTWYASLFDRRAN
ncbi:MAG: hypothetical protein SGI77_13510 [Pirellulaceae bacterium]|nr:hypothetical protein [Pirellulaceae bacterium]